MDAKPNLADMGLSELRDEFVLLAGCALDSGEYRERANELAGELLRRGFGIPEVGAYLFYTTYGQTRA